VSVTRDIVNMDLDLILTGGLSALVLLLIGLILWRGRTSSKADDTEDSEDEERTPVKKAGGPISRESTSGPRRVQRKTGKKPIKDSDNEEDEDDRLGAIEEELGVTLEGKVGKKKLAKLEAKIERRYQRERELEEREERRQRQELLDKKRQQEEKKRQKEETEREEKERLEREERERKEHEEYLALKATFKIQEEGFEEEIDEGGEASQKLQQFIKYIQDQKVVLLEDLAAHFQLKTQDAINRVQSLLASESLIGVIDDRGKFIHITREELESVAKFIRQRGRVSLSELVESSNSLINLSPKGDN